MHSQLYREAGVDVLGFTGVPVFQAEGLTVKTEKSRYTPLFLSKVRRLTHQPAAAEAQSLQCCAPGEGVP